MDFLWKLIDNMSLWSWVGVVIAVLVFAVFIIRIVQMLSRYNREMDDVLISEYQRKMKEENK